VDETCKGFPLPEGHHRERDEGYPERLKLKGGVGREKPIWTGMRGLRRE